MPNTANVTKIIRFSAVDGPGNRAVIFLQGCNYNCSFCHNPETIAQRSETSRWMTCDEIFTEIGSGIKFVRGITVSGGECTLQRDMLIEIFTQARQLGLTTYIDSNGSYDFSKDQELLDLTDSVMLDVKCTDDSEHRRIAAFTNAIVLKNIDTLGSLDKLYEIRTVISPTLMDCEQTVGEAARRISIYPNTRYKLIKYRPNGVRMQYIRDLKTPTPALMSSLETLALENGAASVIIT